MSDLIREQVRDAHLDYDESTQKRTLKLRKDDGSVVIEVTLSPTAAYNLAMLLLASLADRKNTDGQ